MEDFLKTVPVVIMAGGKGMRMRPYSEILPKPLLLYHGTTMIENVIQNYLNAGFSRLIILLCYQGALIQNYLESLCLPAEIRFLHEPAPLGTVGGLYYIQEFVNTSFLLCNCDNLGLFDYAHGFETHRAAKADITVFVKPQRHHIPFGILRYGEGRIIKRIDEKPTISFHASTGIHILEPGVLELLDGHTPMDMPELLNRTAANGIVMAENVGEAEWIDMSL